MRNNGRTVIGRFLHLTRFLWLSAVFALAGILINSGNFDKSRLKMVREFQADIIGLQSEMHEYMRESYDFMKKTGKGMFECDTIDDWIQEIRGKGLNCIIIEKDSLVFWSNNKLPIDRILNQHRKEDRLIRAGNAFYLIDYETYGAFDVVGFLTIKNDFPYENEFLVNEFHKSFDLPAHYQIVREELTDVYPIYNAHGKKVFSLLPGTDNENRLRMEYMASVSYLLAIIFLLMFCVCLLKYGMSMWKSNWWLLAFLGDLVFIRYLMVEFKIPALLYQFNLFSVDVFPDYFFTSYGDFVISSFFILFFAVVVYKYYLIPAFEIDHGHTKTKPLYLFRSAALLILIHLVYVFVSNLFRQLILRPNEIIEVYQIFKINYTGFLVFLVIVFLFPAVFLILDRILETIRNYFSPRNYWLLISISFIGFIIIPGMYLKELDFFAIAFYGIILICLSYFKLKRLKYSYSFFVILVMLLSVYVTSRITSLNEIKEKDIKQEIALQLANEHDPVAESLFNDIDLKLKSDTLLNEMMINPLFETEDILNFLERKYFRGYWNKYGIVYYICSKHDSLRVEPDNSQYNCWDFFGEIVLAQGKRLGDTDFYFLDNLDGVINYLGIFSFNDPVSDFKVNLILDLRSRLVVNELGYPELLLKDVISRDSVINDFSFAKYNSGVLIGQKGEYSYSTSSEDFDFSDSTYSQINKDGYEHLVYHINQGTENDNLIVVSKAEYTAWDIIITFSYIFLFFFLAFIIIWVSSHYPFTKGSFHFGFKQKVQFSMISILILSLVVIGGSVVYFVVQQYYRSNYRNLEEKTQSVFIELQHKLGNLQDIRMWEDEKYSNLDALLIKFSNVFYSDINLYDLNGNILATSRPEVFSRRLLNTYMDPHAYQEIVLNKKARFVQEEKIGELEFISAYVPLTNLQGQELAYINLPYFTRPNEFAGEVSGIILTILNIYVLLILLTISIAVFISNQVTRPLSLIRENIRKIKLGGKNEELLYNRNDEIGSLIQEYNRMVNELTRSAELLVRSERETAWREMAKQIAHEIKNPLTPMRLQVQHLERALEAQPEKREYLLKKFNKTMIEQIDTLSAIATEFSKFAKIPRANNEKVDICQKLRNSANLYKNTDNVEIKMHFEDPQVFVLADKEQLLQVFNNLIKNAIQSIPQSRTGIIEIYEQTREKEVLIQVCDNGAGVPDEVKDKLFTPNFTTKSSGMGLGLSIVKNIIHTAGGEIWYKTRLGEGTCFNIKLPLYQD